MNTQVMKIADIKPAEYNPRQDLKKGDYEYDRLKDSIDKFGFVNPLVVNTRNNVLISGHQRLKVLIEEGATETEVIAVDLDDDRERLLNIAMNRIEGEWDYEKLDALFAEYDTSELVVTGFTKQEIESLFAQNEEDEEYEPEDAEEEAEETDDGAETEPDAEETAPEAPEEPCTIYLSFGDKEAANEWLKEQGIERTFDRSQNIIVKMEGIAYGTATN